VTGIARHYDSDTRLLHVDVPVGRDESGYWRINFDQRSVVRVDASGGELAGEENTARLTTYDESGRSNPHDVLVNRNDEIILDVTRTLERRGTTKHLPVNSSSEANGL
jgi:hypothetical protein